MHLHISTASLFLLLLQAGPCAEPASKVPQVNVEEKALSAEAPAAQAPQQTKTAPSYMRDHSSDARAMRRAAIAGRLEELRGAAARVASDEWSANLRPDYRPAVDVVRAAARAAGSAPALPEALSALGEMGAACAACHRAHGGPKTASGAGGGGGDAMAAHAAAEDALWDGLAFPSDESWARGARGLVEAPALGSDVADVAALARRTSALAQSALAPDAPRAELYGKILSTCASCHSRVGVDPSGKP